jgi:hypothetical protein
MYCDHHSTSWHQICSTLHYWSPRPVACDVPVPDVSPITIRVFLVSPHLQQTNNNHLRGKKTKRKHLPNRYSDPLSKRMVDPTIYQTKKWLIHQSIRKKKKLAIIDLSPRSNGARDGHFRYMYKMLSYYADTCCNKDAILPAHKKSFTHFYLTEDNKLGQRMARLKQNMPHRTPNNSANELLMYLHLLTFFMKT